jgi:AraC-like DNA-binding protein
MFFKITYVPENDTRFRFDISDYVHETDRTEFHTLTVPTEFMGLYFNLGTALQYSPESPGQSPGGTFGKNEFNLVYLPPGEYTFTIPPGRHQSVSIRLDKHTLTHWLHSFPFLQEFLDRTATHQPFTIQAKNLPISAKLYEWIHDILFNVFIGKAQEIYIESRVVSIFTGSLHEIQQLTTPPVAQPLRQGSVIQEAASYILQNLHEPISLQDLSYKYGMNRGKLQEGFRHAYGKTVHEFIVEARITRSLQLLRETSLSVKTIASRLGYKHVTNFSVAFRQRFGFSPSAIRQGSATVPDE